MRSRLLVVLLGLSASGAVGQGVADAYTLVELQRLDPNSPVYPTAINNSGISVGYSREGPVQRPVIFSSDGASTEIALAATSTFSQALNINDEGTVLYTLYSDSVRRIFVLAATGEHHELTAPAGYDEPGAFTLNARGAVAGSVVWQKFPSLDRQFVTVWSPKPDGYEATIYHAEDYKVAVAFTDSGLIGLEQTQTAAGRGMIYDTRSESVVGHISGAQFASLSDINNAGHGVYVFDEHSSDVQTGVTDLATSIYPLGCENSSTNSCLRFGQVAGNAINERNVVVGYCNPVLLDNTGWPNGNYGPQTAFIWSAETSTLRLEDLVIESDLVGWSLTEAVDINDAGWIIGKGTKNGEDAAFLLIPREACAGDVNRDGEVTPTDFTAWINAFNSGCD